MNGSKLDIAWAAGLFEGEGCIYVNPPPKPGGSLVLRTTDRDVLERFHRIVACGKLGKPVQLQAHHKPAWDWRVNAWADIEAVLRAFYPLLGSRRQAKARDMLAQPVLSVPSRPTKTHCKRHHPLDGPEADVRIAWVNGYPQRTCRACSRYRAQERRNAV